MGVRLKEMAAMLDMSERQIQRWDDRQLEQRGWKRVIKQRGKRKITEYMLLNENATSSEVLTQMEQAKLNKLRADTKLVEMKQIEELQKHFDLWSEQFIAVFRKEFAPFKTLLVGMRLDTKTADKLNKVFEQCLNGLQKGLENISPVRNG